MYHFVFAEQSLLTTGIEAKIETLRKGRSKVLEENHNVIYGGISMEDLLKQILSKLDSLDNKIDTLQQGQSRIEGKLDAVYIY